MDPGGHLWGHRLAQRILQLPAHFLSPLTSQQDVHLQIHLQNPLETCWPSSEEKEPEEQEDSRAETRVPQDGGQK